MNTTAAKVDLLGAVILRPGLWDAQAEAWSRLIPRDNPADFVANWDLLVKSGDGEVFDILDPESQARTGVIVVTVCHDFLTPELIVLGAFSSDTYADVTESVISQIDDIAAAKGCRTVRFHTMRPGLIAKALRSGFTVSEVIMRKDIPSHERK